MKQILILLLFPLTIFAQRPLRDSVLVKTDIFTVMYSEKLEQPLWIKYTVQCPNGTAKRTGMDFYTNDSIRTSDANDYVNNVYDKGHLAPAADFNCTKEMLYKTFSYLNCALQDQYLNRGVWRLLEAHERELSKKTKIEVYITVLFGSKKLSTGATIPTAFYKKIVGKGVNECYYFKNEKPIYSSFSAYKCK